MEIKKELTDLLIDSLEELIQIGSNSSFWGATRANSDAILTLTTCLPEFDYYKLRSRCLDRIARDANESGEIINWDEEIWDTSIALMALSSDYGSNKQRILKSLHWLKSRYIHASQSWNEEVWETLLALNAITYSRSKALKGQEDYTYFEGSINWINSLYNTPREGILINWSSTALYLLFAVNARKFEMKDEIRSIIETQIRSSCKQILSSNLDNSDTMLWTSETWSNGLVLWAISEAKCGTFNEVQISGILNWFREKINLEETPVEDRAFACIGLYKYLEYVEALENGEGVSIAIVRENLQNRLSKLINTRIKDFVPNPPLIDKTYHYNYYTINLNRKGVHIALISVATVSLTYFSFLASSSSDDYSTWLSILPVLLGVLATVSQLANFQFFSSKNKED